MTAPFPLTAAGLAFDAIAGQFDERYGGWRSVAAQRRAVRARLDAAFPRGSRVLEIGGGTGEDARWLSARGREVLMTDASPEMVRVARAKLRTQHAPRPLVVPAERLARLAAQRDAAGERPFDGAFSNFAALNCVDSPGDFASGLARLLRPGAPALLVFFGTFCPGEFAAQVRVGAFSAATRRLRRGPVPARLGGCEFTVRYHRAGDISRALAPWFRLRRRVGVGVFVPPSVAEPWISRYPRLLRALELLDRVAARPLAPLGDHVLYWYERTRVTAPRAPA